MKQLLYLNTMHLVYTMKHIDFPMLIICFTSAHYCSHTKGKYILDDSNVAAVRYIYLGMLTGYSHQSEVIEKKMCVLSLCVTAGEYNYLQFTKTWYFKNVMFSGRWNMPMWELYSALNDDL